MKEEFKKAFTEVNNIINMIPEELKIKIPNSFVTLIEQENNKMVIYQEKWYHTLLNVIKKYSKKINNKICIFFLNIQKLKRKWRKEKYV